jgi:hypothetical protein
MESAETISAGHRGASPVKSFSRISVLPEAVGPKRSKTGRAPSNGTIPVSSRKIASRAAVLPRFPSFFDTEINLAGKDLPGRQGNHLAIVHFDLFIPDHGKLKGSTGSGAGNFVHITVIFN